MTSSTSVAAEQQVPGAAGMALPQFLRTCADLLASPDPAYYDEDLVRACRRFVDGGLASLHGDRDAVDWFQFDLAYGESGRHGCYPDLLAAVRDLLAAGRIEDFFFMHKPPGVRVRLHPVPGAEATVDQTLRGQLRDWHRAGRLRGWQATRYEPETLLFGGPVSMRSVHGLMTADSLLWLAYHSVAARGGSPGPVWALSMLMVRAVFEAVQIVGWEDLDVWDRVRWQTGRRLASRLTGQLDLGPLIATLRAGWAEPATMLDLVAPELHGPLAEYRDSVAEQGRRWLRDYFRSGTAALGPRAALAYLIVFHWNRAGLSTIRQCLLTEAMATHPALRPGEVAR